MTNFSSPRSSDKFFIQPSPKDSSSVSPEISHHFLLSQMKHFPLLMTDSHIYTKERDEDENLIAFLDKVKKEVRVEESLDKVFTGRFLIQYDGERNEDLGALVMGQRRKGSQLVE